MHGHPWMALLLSSDGCGRGMDISEKNDPHVTTATNNGAENPAAAPTDAAAARAVALLPLSQQRREGDDENNKAVRARSAEGGANRARAGGDKVLAGRQPLSLLSRAKGGPGR